MWPREKLYRHGENSKLNTEKPDEKNLWSPHKTKFSKNSNCIWLWCFCSVVQQRKDFHIEYILNGENQQLMFFKKLTDGDETHLLTYMGDRRRDGLCVCQPTLQWMRAVQLISPGSSVFYSAEVLMYWFFPAAIFQSYKINSRCAKIFSPHHFVYLCSQYKTINNVQGYPALQCN